MKSLEIRDLSVRVGTPARAIVDGASFRLEPGKVYALFGPNGAGKSSVAKALARLIPFDGGTILWDGEDAARFGAREWSRRVTYVGSHLSTEFPMRVGEYVGLGAEALGTARAAAGRGETRIARLERSDVERKVAELALEPIWGREIFVLSQGERQRAMIARALLQRSPVVILDETFSHLDLHHQTRLGLRLREWAAEGGMTFVVISHDLNFAGEIADQLFFLADGRLAAEGAPRELLTIEALKRLYPDAEISMVPGPSGLPKVFFR